MRKITCLLVTSLFLSISLAAQTLPSGEGPGAHVWIGASISTFNPDYGCQNSQPFSCWNQHLWGIAPYASTSAFLFQRVGAEGQARFLHWNGPGGLTENSYMAGPRVRLYRHRNVLMSAKLLVGKAHLTIPSPGVGSGTYFAFAPGASIDYRIARRVAVRGDYEYQTWPNFKGTRAGHSGLTPNGISFGVSYALW